MDLFAFVKLKEPKRATVGVCPLRDGEQPILEATDEHLTVFGPVNRPNSPPAAVYVPPVQSVPPTGEQSPVVEEAHSESSDSVEILEPAVETHGEKRKGESSGGYGAGTSKRRHHVLADEESSTPDDVSVSGAEKDLSRSPPLV
jgi:hypothetical protein